MKKQTLSPILIHVPFENNKLLEQALTVINESVEIKTLWKVINVNAIERLGMTDHGPVHFQIVANSSLRLMRLLLKKRIKMSITQNYGLSKEYAELGMSINRDGHEEFSLIIANQLLREILSFLPTEERVIVASETLHAIISHRSGGRPITIEAGIVRVADALDMSKGRSRIPFEAGKVDIHSVSAYAIEKVEISAGRKKPIQIDIVMSNSAGVFQIDELLKSKLKNSGIEQYMGVRAYMKNKNETSLVEEYVLQKS